MKKPLDRFSIQSSAYKKHRPVYPSALYEEILGHVITREKCWDCGTGNGQVAEALSTYFRQVEASDLSENQLAQAPNLPNVHYSIQRAENTNFADDQFDLITVGQAVHWFDFEAFHSEVLRVSKPGGIVAIWGYGLLKVDERIDELTTEFDRDIVGPYWDVERRHIDSAYETIPFNFDPIKVKHSFVIEESWNTDRLEGYFNSWSCVQNYKQKHSGNSPVSALMERISEYWKAGETKKVSFPIFLRMGRIDK
ncbi:Methyltransferase domain-containing protein [Reichenbachiella faecimaris]|uniref:Methyltransferase domain-containing protein n=1 Tax=Reichenbachiella faecimaris TaxID=692418 RepID=A0A1W2GE45_REIFA|nr:class I SAM-dependent methyltransferase [Reichenbachiella faecimaris]SMD34762.1 Methyltransferase domain-containing protein [Reichenbachiella faecimaris]